MLCYDCKKDKPINEFSNYYLPIAVVVKVKHLTALDGSMYHECI